jgi:hypothetical protein
MSRVLRALGAFDIASGALALVIASWLSDQLGVGTGVVRGVGVFLVVLGADKVVFADRSGMPRVAAVVEGLFALACLDVAVTAEQTTIGTVLLLGTVAGCAALAVWLFAQQRTRSLVAA